MRDAQEEDRYLQSDEENFSASAGMCVHAGHDLKLIGW